MDKLWVLGLTQGHRRLITAIGRLLHSVKRNKNKVCFKQFARRGLMESFHGLIYPFVLQNTLPYYND
jgi:hypothetical protein